MIRMFFPLVIQEGQQDLSDPTGFEAFEMSSLTTQLDESKVAIEDRTAASPRYLRINLSINSVSPIPTTSVLWHSVAKILAFFGNA
jgi:hypothetical protein